MNAVETKRDYTKRAYNSKEVSEAISIFLLQGGSLRDTQETLKVRWGHSPTEPTLRKWLRASNEAMNLLDQNAAANLQDDIGNIISLSHELLVKELESGNFPSAKLGTLYGIMIDKFFMISKVRNELARSVGKSDDIIGDELLGSPDPDFINALLQDGKVVLENS